MKTILDPVDRAEVIGRLRKLTPDAKAQWGKFTVGTMVTHLLDSTRMTLDEIKGMRTGMPILSWPGFKQLFMLGLPFGKGAPTAPQLLTTKPAEIATDVDKVVAQLERFAKADAPVAATHPAFGAMTKDTWGKLGYRHFDHHLRQFGV